MTALVRAELLKRRSTRADLWVLGIMIALILFAVLLHGFALRADALADRDGQMHVFGWGGLGALFAGLAGAISMTAELRYGTIRSTFLVTPRRERVVAAKGAAAALLGIAFGLVAEVCVIGVGDAALRARGIPVRLDAGDYAQLVAGGVLAAALWGPIGLGLGALVRNQVATVVGLFAWVLFVEGLVFGLLPGEGRLLPGMAGAAIAGVTTTGELGHLLSPAAGALLLAAYVVPALALGALVTARRDVA